MILTILEVLSLTSSEDYEKFCTDYGYDVWVVAEGSGHLQVTMDIDTLKKYNILKSGE